MISVRHYLLACAGGLLLAPFAAVAQSETQPETAPPATQAPAPEPEDDAANGAPAEAAEADKLICRYVKLDTASRRKTKVCRTVDGWRELNNPR